MATHKKKSRVVVRAEALKVATKAHKKAARELERVLRCARAIVKAHATLSRESLQSDIRELQRALWSLSYAKQNARKLARAALKA